MTKHYELLYLVSPNFSDEELGPVKEKVRDLIVKFGGEITFEDSLGKKKLAYPIQKHFQGYYLLYTFYLDGAELKELERQLRLTNELLRHVIVNRPYQENPQPLAQTFAEKPAETFAEPAKAKADDKNKIKLEDLDEKLDQILGEEII